jgi:hypothetical protein
MSAPVAFQEDRTIAHDRKWHHRKRPCPEQEVTVVIACACATVSRVLSYYSTKCSTVVQVPWLPEVT